MEKFDVLLKIADQQRRRRWGRDRRGSGRIGSLHRIANPKHEEHQEWLDWRGPFDPEEFDVKTATREMRKVK